MVRKYISKLLILLGLLTSLGLAGQAQAYCYYSNCYNSGGYYGGYSYVNSVVGLNPNYWPKSYVAAYGVNQFFQAVQEGWTMLEQGKAIETEINVRRNNLENYKSVQRYYNEGIPPFAHTAPNGKPRSPKITFQDVESIH